MRGSDDVSLPHGMTWTEWSDGSYRGIRTRCPSSDMTVSVIWEPDGTSHLGLRDKAGHYVEAIQQGQQCAELIVRALEEPDSLKVKEEINPRCDLCGELTEGHWIPGSEITVCETCLDGPEIAVLKQRWFDLGDVS